MIRAFIIVFAIVAFGDLMHRAVFWVNFVQPVKTIFADIIGNVAKFIITGKNKVESHQETETKNKKQKQNQLDSWKTQQKHHMPPTEQVCCNVVHLHNSNKQIP